MEVEEAEAGVSFPVLIHLTNSGQVRTLIIDEPNTFRMNALFKHVCVKKGLYGRPDNPDRIVLVVNHNFTALITVIRCDRNPSNWKIPASWQKALEKNRTKPPLMKVSFMFQRFLPGNYQLQLEQRLLTRRKPSFKLKGLPQISQRSLFPLLPRICWWIRSSCLKQTIGPF